MAQTIENMNKDLSQQEKKAKLIKASELVRKESMVINSEFAKIENDPEV